MRENRLVTFLTNVAENIVANIVIIVVPILIGLVYTLYSNNPQIALQWVLIVLVTVNILVTLFVFQGQRSAAQRRSTGMLVRDIQTKTMYFVDVTGRAREIPDEETSSFLENALGVIGPLPEMPTSEIAKLRGEKLRSIRKWERPMTPEEQAIDELRRKAQRALDVTSWRFDDTSDPQKMVVQFTNRGDKVIYIVKIKFQSIDLGDLALLTSYPRDDIYTVVPFDESNSNLAPGTNLQVELLLAQKWLRPDIERIKGNLGFLILDVVYEGTQVDTLFML